MPKIQIVETKYDVCNKFGMKVAVLADIHFRHIDELLLLLEKSLPNVIVIPGDLVDGTQVENSISHKKVLDEAINLLDKLSEIAPTYLSIGNHENHFTKEEIEELYKSRAVILQEKYHNIREDIYIGGLSSCKNYRGYMSNHKPDLRFVDEFEKLKGFKILLSHHPEYYDSYLKNKEIDIIVAGHAHGGQVRLFNRGLFAPGQGLFPKYSGGIYDDRFIVSRGIGGTELLPRINNKPEIVYINI